MIAIGEAYLQRLIRGGQYDIAGRSASLRSHAAPIPRCTRISRPASPGSRCRQPPAIVGRDVDGKTIRLEDLKGKVVLVDFWATWCPPCVAMFPELQTLQASTGKDGFVILGVNLDARREDVGDVAKASPVVRQFLLNTHSWPNILVGTAAAGDPASAFGVEEIPANFLIDRAGKIIHLELTGPELEKAIRGAL